LNWLEALRETVLEFQDEYPEWGRVDCCQFARNYYSRLTGKDVGADFDYSSQYDAGRIVASHGGIEGLLTHILGEPSDTAKAGDVVTVDLSNGGEVIAAGVFNGNRVWTIHPEKGLFMVRMERIREAWQPE